MQWFNANFSGSGRGCVRNAVAAAVHTAPHQVSFFYRDGAELVNMKFMTVVNVKTSFKIYVPFPSQVITSACSCRLGTHC